MQASFNLRMSPSPAALVKVFEQLGAEFRDWRPAWRAVLPLVARGLSANIESRGSSLGEVWPELGADSLRKRQRQGRGRSLLQFTGRLYREVKGERSGTRSLTKRRLAFGPKQPYAFVQHYGSQRRNIPARPFIGWSATMAAGVIAAMELHARALVAKAEQKIGLLSH